MSKLRGGPDRIARGHWRAGSLDLISQVQCRRNRIGKRNPARIVLHNKRRRGQRNCSSYGYELSLLAANELRYSSNRGDLGLLSLVAKESAPQCGVIEGWKTVRRIERSLALREVRMKYPRRWSGDSTEVHQRRGCNVCTLRQAAPVARERNPIRPLRTQSGSSKN